MNTKTQVDSRMFREFYTDPAIRHRVHDGFANRFLPVEIHQNPYGFFFPVYCEDFPGGVIDPTLYIHTRWGKFEEMAELVQIESDPFKSGMVFRRVSDLTMSTHEVAGRPVALVQMPTPERPVESFYVAAALLASPGQPKSWPHDVQARVFTLEVTFSKHFGEGNTGMFCEWTRDGEHRNFRILLPAEPDAFLQAVAEVLQAPDAPAAAGFVPPKDGKPAKITFGTGKEVSALPPAETRKPWWKIW
jgi:hypothetical protein